jgi:hypothetical protein
MFLLIGRRELKLVYRKVKVQGRRKGDQPLLIKEMNSRTYWTIMRICWMMNKTPNLGKTSFQRSYIHRELILAEKITWQCRGRVTSVKKQFGNNQALQLI